MSGSEPREGGDLPLRVRAEAAAWLASLGGPHRTPELTERFGRWLAHGEPHRIAWERVSDAWDLAGGLAAKMQPREDVSEVEGRPRRRTLVLAAAVLLAAAAALGLLLSRAAAVSTGTGERRVLSLEDGSRITLNTDTRLAVRYDSRSRRVWLERGEALFEVRRAPGRPFVVTAGGRDIRALGTAFEVRRYGAQQVSITLVEGRISVTPAGAASSALLREVTVLSLPGQRVTFLPGREPSIDRPVLKQVIAWQNGEVVFDDTPLGEAAREMNRYSERHILIEDPQVAVLRVSGLFQAGDSTEFAQGVAETFGLRAQDVGDRIILLRSARAPSPSR